MFRTGFLKTALSKELLRKASDQAMKKGRSILGRMDPKSPDRNLMLQSGKRLLQSTKFTQGAFKKQMREWKE